MINFVKNYNEIKFNYNKALIITDENIDKLYQLPFNFPKLVLPAGESTKSISTLEKIYSKCIEVGLTRSDCLVAFGGGVIGDVTGFAAATYLRGIDFIQVPTTIVAQCDSSVGGKTGINLKAGKNLVGSFHLPKEIYINVSVLDTLPQRVYSDGMAEVIKHAAIADEKLFNKLLEVDKIDEDIVRRNTEIKWSFAGDDLKDVGQRMMLNFGHTFGHAVEQFYNYEKYTHGEAVAIGMMKITQISERLGLTEKGTSEKLKQLLVRWGLPTQVDIEIKPENDKKTFGDEINLIMLKKIGEAFIHPVKVEEFSWI